VSSENVPNCFVFDKDNETCLQCVGYGRSYNYLPPFGSSIKSGTQSIPSGGGKNDYGLSADGKICHDNFSKYDLYSPHCYKYEKTIRLKYI
jgi:hypothetical protein